MGHTVKVGKSLATVLDVADSTAEETEDVASVATLEAEEAASFRTD